jgi:hypothetical protein
MNRTVCVAERVKRLTNTMTKSTLPILPYVDTKPVGAADFYFAINATFRFVLNRFGMEGLRRYWRDLGTAYYAPVSQRWRDGGLASVAAYWEAFFQAEPKAEVQIEQNSDAVIVRVACCPAIAHLRDNGRAIVPCFCQHCYFVSEAIAVPAGMTVCVEGGNGTCVQTFRMRSDSWPAQDLQWIKEAT